jgi:hypothetical protein
LSRSILLLAILVLGGCTCGSAAPESAPAPVTYVAARADAMTIDGELEEPIWTAHEPTARFVDAVSGELIPPYTEARAVCDDEALTFAVYAADEDLRSTDRMGAVLHAGGATHVLEMDPNGALRWHAPSEPPGDAPPGVTSGVDRDGTVDHEDIDDEEWIIEVRVPWSVLGMSGPGELRANFFRRDQPRNSPIRTLAWTPWHDHTSADLSTLGLIRCAAP